MNIAVRVDSGFARFRAELDRNYRGPLLAYFLRRVGNRSEAEDLTQEVFARILNQSDAIDPGRAKSYVFAAAGNLLKDRARRATIRRVETLASFDEDADLDIPELTGGIDPERALIAKETLKEVLEALDGLNRRTRDIFLLYRVEQMNQVEIASACGLSQGSVKKHLVKAIRHLSERFGRA